MARPFERFERSVFCHFRKYQVQLITLVEQNSQASPCKNVCVLCWGEKRQTFLVIYSQLMKYKLN